MFSVEPPINNPLLRPSCQHHPMDVDDHSPVVAILTRIRRAFAAEPGRVLEPIRALEPSRIQEPARVVEPARLPEPTRVDYRWEATRSLF